MTTSRPYGDDWRKISHFEGGIPEPMKCRVEIRCHCGARLGGIYLELEESYQTVWLVVEGWRRGKRQRLAMHDPADDMRLAEKFDETPHGVSLNGRGPLNYLLKCRKHPDDAWKPQPSEVMEIYASVQKKARTGIAIIRQGDVIALRYT